MEHLEEIILDYVNTDTSNNYAVMITGGKWKDALFQSGSN